MIDSEKVIDAILLMAKESLEYEEERFDEIEPRPWETREMMKRSSLGDGVAFWNNVVVLVEKAQQARTFGVLSNEEKATVVNAIDLNPDISFCTTSSNISST